MKKAFNGALKFFWSDKLFAVGLILFAGALVYSKQESPSPIAAVALFIAAYVLIGHNILLSTLKNILKGKIFDENFLMTIASVGAFCLGYYAEAAGVMLFYKAGEFFQDQASEKATRSIQAMLDIRPETANVLTDKGILRVPAQEVGPETLIKIAPGEKVPLDGIVTDGSTHMNTAALTGESAPRAMVPGNEVLAGFVNGEGLITVKTTKEFGETVFSKVIKMVKESQAQKATTEKFITRFARYYTPAVVLLAACVAVIPPLVLPGALYSVWIYRALVFLVISCPCALLLSVPLSFFAGIGASAKKGIFVKGGHYLEALARTRTMVFDKTGTLTVGKLAVSKVTPLNGFSREDILRYAAMAERHSSHPVARCLVQAYYDDFVQTAGQKQTALAGEYTHYREIPGKGVDVEINGERILVGRPAFLKENGIAPGGFNGSEDTFVAVNGKLTAEITIKDTVRPDAEKSLGEIRAWGVKRLYMLSGDNSNSAKAVAEELGLDGYAAQLLPGEKVDRLVELMQNQPANQKIAFVGDGVNDAPSLARSDVGIAMGGAGSDAALEAADIVLMQDDLSRIPEAVKIAHKTRTIAYQNIVGAIGLKVVIMFLGTLGYTALWMAIFADVGVALLAVLNSLRVLRV